MLLVGTQPQPSEQYSSGPADYELPHAVSQFPSTLADHIGRLRQTIASMSGDMLSDAGFRSALGDRVKRVHNFFETGRASALPPTEDPRLLYFDKQIDKATVDVATALSQAPNDKFFAAMVSSAKSQMQSLTGSTIEGIKVLNAIENSMSFQDLVRQKGLRTMYPDKDAMKYYFDGPQQSANQTSGFQRYSNGASRASASSAPVKFIIKVVRDHRAPQMSEEEVQSLADSVLQSLALTQRRSAFPTQAQHQV